MSILNELKSRLRVPMMGAPLFIISNPDLVIAQCTSGVVGSFPSLNARSVEQLEAWLDHINSALAAWDQAHPDAPAAPYAVNLIVHKSNERLEEDLAVCAKFKVPLVITSLGARESVNEAVHEWGGLVFHDVTTNAFAQKAVEKGADGLIAVAAGAGGHAGTLSPFALLQEIRSWFLGPLALSGALCTGRTILAAQTLGADFAYMGSLFIATEEANAEQRYKQMIVESSSADIVYSNLFSGVHGNYLRPSIAAAGLNPDELETSDPSQMNFGSGGNMDAKVWRDIWGAGQGIGAVTRVVSTEEAVGRLRLEYDLAKQSMFALLQR